MTGFEIARPISQASRMPRTRLPHGDGEDQVFRRSNQFYRLMLDLGFLGDAGLLDALRGGGDRLGLLRHLAIGEILDLVGVLGRLMVSVGIFFDIAVGVGEHLANLVVGDPRTECGHRCLQRRERRFGALGGTLLMATKQLVDIQPRQQQLLEGFAGQDRVVRVACLDRRHVLQLLDHDERLRTERIENACGQFVLLLLQRDELVEIFGVFLELLTDLGHPGATLGVLDLVESLLDAFCENFLLLAGFDDQFLVPRKREFPYEAAEGDEAAIDVADDTDHLDALVEGPETRPRP